MPKYFFIFQDQWSVLAVVLYLLLGCDVRLKKFTFSCCIYLFVRLNVGAHVLWRALWWSVFPSIWGSQVLNLGREAWWQVPPLSPHPQLIFLECFPKSCPKQRVPLFWVCGGMRIMSHVFSILFFPFSAPLFLWTTPLEVPTTSPERSSFYCFPSDPHFCDTAWRRFQISKTSSGLGFGFF